MAEKKKNISAIEELRALDAKKLTEKLSELQAELVEFRRSHAAGELPNPRVLRNTRRQIARTRSVISEMNNKAKEKNNG